ncbi:hypothetical protein PV767_18720 [Stenotrophomonas rhizophila]|uniref:hypothetical protein n=1 Tax=Stenotrophomonas TaxID=40323 RepID=UPI003B7F3D58
MKTPHRQTLENRAARLGLELSEAGRYVKMEAANNCEAAPRWELSDGKHQSTLRGYATLAEVSEALAHEEISR